MEQKIQALLAKYYNQHKILKSSVNRFKELNPERAPMFLLGRIRAIEGFIVDLESLLI